MTSKRQKYVRQEKNGKIVYVPNADRSSRRKPSGRGRPRSQGQFNPVGEMFSWFGDTCVRWFPPIAMTGAAGLTLGLGWLGWQGLTNPDMIFWVNQFTPDNLNRKIPADDQPKTVDEVLAQIKRNNKIAGEVIVINSDFSFSNPIDSATAIAIPILEQQDGLGCPDGCDAIQAIQVYRVLELPRLIQIFQRKRRYRKASKVMIYGPSEANLNRLVRSLTRSGSSEGSSASMLMPVIKMHETKDGNRWLLLSGLKTKGSASATYGQILRVNPKRVQLNVMANWLSPSGKSPEWKDVTGDGQDDIVIDQSIELERSFSVYEINKAPNGETLVKALSLSKPAIASTTYKNALQLAKSGLWEQAETQLEIFKANGGEWSEAAQAQLSLVQLHTHALEQDVSLAFSDPVAEIQSRLIRGDWENAHTQLLQSRQIYDGLEIILESDNGQLGDRIHTAAKVGPDRTAAVDWGIIYHYARGGKAQAQSWLKTNYPQYQSRLEPMFKKLSYPPKKPKSPSQKTDSQAP